MNKTEFIAAYAAKTNTTISASSEVVNGVLGLITDTVKGGTDINLTGFGAFKVKERAARTAVKPGTTEKIQIPAKKAVRFTVGSGLKF